MHEEIGEYLVIYDEAVSHISLCYGPFHISHFLTVWTTVFTEAKFLDPDRG